MHLKSITVKGFKSFPERTRLEFGPGVSVIVGPNGSGKSNVTDAVLWALGEQSPVAIRGQSMQDVIFGGAPGRQAAAHAEVELVLDDSDGSLGLGMPEIAIQRRLDRTGEGEYRLGGARCRLVDIVELLSDTGLGREMHSVISQGRVESLVTSKPRERRLLIEEAAGLGKHRKRRRRAQLKLARTQDNLDRALDVEREARSRLRPLKRQAEAAELHDRLERQALEIRWQLSRDDALKRRAAVAAAERGAAAARERRRELELKLEAVASRREEAEEMLAARSAQREELSRRAYSARGAAERVSYRLESVRSAARAVNERLERWGAVAADLERQLEGEREDPEVADRIAVLKESIAALDRDHEVELERQIAELGIELDAAQMRVGEREREAQRSRAERELAEASVEAARGELREAERIAEAARREAARVGAELSVVNQFLRNHARAPGGGAPLSDELEVDAGFELAVAAALDGRLGAAVVEDLPSGGSLLDRVGADGGRVLIAWPADAARAGSDSRAPIDGAVPLLDHIRGRGNADALARSLLRDAWLVEDLTAMPPQFRGLAVTRSGRVWVGGTRELRQAAAHGEERVLAERNRRDALIAESERAAQHELQARGGVARSTAALAGADSERDHVTGLHRAAVRALDEANEERERLLALIERRRNAPDDGPDAGRRAQLLAELVSEERMLARIARDRADRLQRLRRLRDAQARDRELVPTLAALVSALETTAAAIAHGREAFDRALAADRQAGETVAGALRACAREEAELQAALGRENESLMEAEVRLQRARDHCAETEAELARLAGRLELEGEAAEAELDDEQRADLDARLGRLARRREQIGPVNPLAQREYSEAVEHVETLEAQRTDLEAALRELEHLIADTDRQIRTTFEQTFQATAAAFEELVEQLFPGGKGRLRLVADGEGSGRPARVIGGQPAPVEGGESDADRGEGGDDDEPREEDLLGVEIEITPAGKERRRLSLLSGGEKSMTALAFLFAVFLARPCPFYILDEVEAALDDLNIDRFLTLLRKYSSRAQFIVVTHQKRTMEAADSLYGVSMSADGVSKVISRRLPEAAEAA